MDSLTRSERDDFWADYVRFGELFGMPGEVAPGSWAEFKRWFDGRVNGPDSFLTEDARYVGAAVMFHIPTAWHGYPAMRAHNLVMRGSLPHRVRELYGIGWSSAHEAAFRAVVAGSRATRPLAPDALRRGYNTKFFDDVAEAERARIRHGKPVWGALTDLPRAPTTL